MILNLYHQHSFEMLVHLIPYLYFLIEIFSCPNIRFNKVISSLMVYMNLEIVFVFVGYYLHEFGDINFVKRILINRLFIEISLYKLSNNQYVNYSFDNFLCNAVILKP